MPDFGERQVLSFDNPADVAINAFDIDEASDRVVALGDEAGPHGRAVLFFALSSAAPVHSVPLAAERTGVGEVVRLSPDRSRVAVALGQAEGFAIFETVSGTELMRTRLFDNQSAHGLDWHASGNTVYAAGGTQVEAFAVDGETAVQRYRRSLPIRLPGHVLSLSANPAPERDQTLVGTNQNRCYIVDENGTGQLEPDAGGMGQAAWSDDAQLLVYLERGRGGRVMVWRFGEHRRTLEAPSDTDYSAMAFEPGSHRAVIATNDGAIRIYDMDEGTVVETLQEPTGTPPIDVLWRDQRVWAWSRDTQQGLAAWATQSAAPLPQRRPTAPAGRATVIVRAVGSNAAAATVWSGSLFRGDRVVAAERFSSNGTITFERLPAGEYVLRLDTRADVGRGPDRREHRFSLTGDSTHEVEARFE